MTATLDPRLIGDTLDRLRRLELARGFLPNGGEAMVPVSIETAMRHEKETGRLHPDCEFAPSLSRLREIEAAAREGEGDPTSPPRT